jgi:glycine/D-amino acid oxidase-like deaminating enzyme
MSSSANEVVNGGISFWYADDGLPAVREPLAGDTTADVVIVGGGYTGYGASGRNGGWLYNGIAGRDRYARLHGHEAAVRLQKAMNETVDEVVRVAGEEGVEAGLHKGGVLEVACTPAQLARLKAFHEHELSYGETDRVLYDARETAERIRVADAVGSTWTPHGARLHPAKLVKGLAAAVEALGVSVHEATPVTEIRPKHAVTPYGTVRAPYVLRCTEGFTANLKGQRRTWLPMNSSMIATEPLTDEQWEPEPLRWLGVQGLYATYRAADRRERTTRAAESSRLARIADQVAGRH